jgi:hypothetical protein
MSLRSELGPTVRSCEAIRTLVHLPRPASMRAMLIKYKEPIVFDEPLNTPDGVALGGHHRITLERDGGFHHEGHMRATGFPSFTFGVRTVLANEAGVPAVVAVSGRVHGTNEPGDREFSWQQLDRQGLVAWHWPAMKNAQAETSIQRDSDIFGTFGEIAGFVFTLSAGAVIGGPAGVCLMLGIHGADAIGLDEDVGIGGLAGVVAAGSVLVIFGPTAIIPAIVFGAAVGTAFELALEHRPMTPDEIAFAERVFGPTLPIDRILLTNMLGIGRRPFTIPTVGSKILVNLGAGFHDPVNYTGLGDTENPNQQSAGQLFIHELTHAWQIEHRSFLPGLMCEAISSQSTTLGGNMSVYKYGNAGPNFSEFNPEQQGSIIDDWFAGSGNKQKEFGASVENDSNPYFRYIRDNIRNRLP